MRAFFFHRPALAIVDIVIPYMNGFKLLYRIREVSGAAVILLSGNGRAEAKVRGLSLGADDYLVKPVEQAEMLARVEAALRRAKGAKGLRPDADYHDGLITSLSLRIQSLSRAGRQSSRDRDSARRPH